MNEIKNLNDEELQQIAGGHGSYSGPYSCGLFVPHSTQLSEAYPYVVKMCLIPPDGGNYRRITYYYATKEIALKGRDELYQFFVRERGYKNQITQIYNAWKAENAPED